MSSFIFGAEQVMDNIEEWMLNGMSNVDDESRNSLSVTNRRLFTSDSSVRATGGSTVYQMNCRHISKGNTIVPMSGYSRVQVYCIHQSVVQCEPRLKLAFLP